MSVKQETDQPIMTVTHKPLREMGDMKNKEDQKLTRCVKDEAKVEEVK